MANESGQFITTTTNTVNIPINGENDRIEKFRYRYKMLNDNFYNQVEKELGNVYTKSKELGLISQIDDTNNLFRMIIEEISKVYDYGVNREFSEDENIQEYMNILYDELDINELLIQSNTYINAFNDVLIQVGVNDTDELTVRLRRPDNTIIKYDNDLKLEEVYVYVTETDNGQKWYGYTADEMFMVIVPRAEDVLTAVERMPQDGSEDMTNPLGYLPFIAIHNGFRDDEFWQMYKGDDLVKGTIQVAIKLTFLNHLIKLQSFKQLVASGSNLQQLHGAVLDPQTILFVEGQDTKVEALNLESNYKALWETIQSINNNIAMNYKISPSTFRLTGSPTSGFALKMENLKLDKFISKQQKMYEKVERDLFNLLKKIDESMQLGLIPADSVSVLFPPVQYPKTEEEIIDINTKEIELALDNQISVIMEREGVDKETATEMYNENIRIRNQANEQFNTQTPTTTLPGINEGN